MVAAMRGPCQLFFTINLTPLSSLPPTPPCPFFGKNYYNCIFIVPIQAPFASSSLVLRWPDGHTHPTAVSLVMNLIVLLPGYLIDSWHNWTADLTELTTVRD